MNRLFFKCGEVKNELFDMPLMAFNQGHIIITRICCLFNLQKEMLDADDVVMSNILTFTSSK